MSETPPNDRPDEQPDEQTDEQESPLTEEEERLGEGLDVAGVLADVAANQPAPTYVPDPVAIEMAVALMFDERNELVLVDQRTIILRYITRVVGNIDVAEDLTHETLEAMLRNIRTHHARRTSTGELDMNAFRGWYLSIARNRVLMYVRMQRVRQTRTGFSDRQMEIFGGTGLTVEEELARRELAGDIFNRWAKAAKLTPDQYTVLWLHDVDEFSTTEVAGMVGKAEGTVRAAMSRGRDRLAGWLAQNGYADWVDEGRKRSRAAR